MNIKKIFSDKAFLIQLIGFVMLQIFIDMYRPFFESRYQVFGISLPEIVNLFCFAVLTFVFLVKAAKKPKVLIPVGIYSLCLILYLVFHFLNLAKFDQSILHGSEKNLFKEFYFILRTYLLPVFLSYYFLCSKIDRFSFKKTVSSLSLIISTNIIFTNIFKISFVSYAATLEKNTFITKNIFQWFFDPDITNPYLMTSKGWFYMGNQIGLILLMLFVFVMMFALESGKMGDYLVLFSNALAMLMVSTQVATLGCVIVLILGFVFAVVFGMLLKQFPFGIKNAVTYAVIAAVCFSILPFSPMVTIQSQQEQALSVTEEQENEREKLKDRYEKIKSDIKTLNGKEAKKAEEEMRIFKEEFCSLLYNKASFFGFEPNFLYLLPVENNFEFWFETATGDNEHVDYRKFKAMLFQEVLELNENKTGDRLWGIGYISGFPYTEQDFVSQNIFFGYAGTLLLIGPYYLLFLWGIFLALKKIRSCFIYENAFFALFLGLSTLLSFMAGHLFYSLFSIVIFALISAYFFKFQTERYRIS